MNKQQKAMSLFRSIIKSGEPWTKQAQDLYDEAMGEASVEIIPRHAQCQVMRALTMAYRKHRLGDDSIGWEELEVVMSCALQEAMGDEGFCDWLDALQIRKDDD